MATILLKDANGVNVAVEMPLAPGRKAAADSRPIVFSTEDLAAINALAIANGRAAAASSKSFAVSNEDKAVLDAQAASLVTIASWNAAARAAVNLIPGQAGVAAGAGNTDALTQRVVLATNSAGITTTVDHDAPDSVAAVLKVGGQARTTNPTAVADADRAHFITDKLSKLISVSAIREMKGKQRTQIASSTTETTVVAAAASTFHDLYGLILSNTSATAVNVTLREATGGAIIHIFALAAGAMGGFMLDPGAAIPQTTVNNNWTCQCSASVANVEVTAMFVKNT